MRILVENPPFIDDLRSIFRLPAGAIFTFGDTIFNPSNNPIDEPLMLHETLHSKQQGNNPQEWWKRYLVDKDFRLAMEIPAYQIQFHAYKKLDKNRDRVHRFALRLASDLSGGMYGDCISFMEAVKAIKSDKVYNFNTHIDNQIK